MSDWMEGDYPTEAALQQLERWYIKGQADIDALWAFARELWIYPDRFVPTEGDAWPFDDADWYVSTGGWSGHEDVIDALRSNAMFWILCFRVQAHGGHFWFEIKNRIKP